MDITNENKKVAKTIFEAQPKCNEVWVNKKGEYFTQWDLAADSVDNPKEQLASIKREGFEFFDVSTPEKLIELTVDEIEEAVKTINDKELLVEAVKLETQTKNRSGAKQAIGNKIDSFNKAD